VSSGAAKAREQGLDYCSRLHAYTNTTPSLTDLSHSNANFPFKKSCSQRPNDPRIWLLIYPSILRLLLLCISRKHCALPHRWLFLLLRCSAPLCRVTLFSATPFRQHPSDEEFVRASLALVLAMLEIVETTGGDADSNLAPEKLKVPCPCPARNASGCHMASRS
jgi:hypothetical protein